MKIAILHCRKANEVCTGAACLNAFNHSTKHFIQYQDNPAELMAFCDCGGCGINRSAHKGMIEKMERLQQIGVEKIHIGVCLTEKCPDYANIFAMLEAYKIPFEVGTH